jgi:hypothetical protein
MLEGLKAITFTTHMSRHETAAYSTGNALLYFDPQDGEYLFDSVDDFCNWLGPESRDYGLYSIAYFGILTAPLHWPVGK